MAAVIVRIISTSGFTIGHRRDGRRTGPVIAARANRARRDLMLRLLRLEPTALAKAEPPVRTGRHGSGT